MSISQRIESFLNYQKISQTDFENVTGFSQRTLSNIISETTKNPKMDFFVAMATYYPNINIRWLLIGEGEMLNQENKEAPEEKENEEARLNQKVAIMIKEQEKLYSSFLLRFLKCVLR